VDITGGEPPTTYRNTIKLALDDERIHASFSATAHYYYATHGFATLLSEVVEEARQRGIHKPVVASLVGDVEVEEACRYLNDHQLLAYPYTTEKLWRCLGPNTVGQCCWLAVRTAEYTRNWNRTVLPPGDV